jgi:hypothetical protein
MAGRILAICTILVALVFELGCGQSAQLSSITVTPSTATIPNVGGTAQFQATGNFVNGKNGNQHNENMTNQVTWTSSTPTVATINSSGLAAAVGVGTTTITATGGNGGLASTATLTVANGANGNTLQSIDVIPVTQAVNQPGETAQYIAIGNYSGNPPTQDLTDQVTWSSSDVRIATINSSGLATGVGDCGGGQTTITALAPANSGTAVTGIATFSTGTCGGNNLPTLTVYKVGQGTGVVTSAPGGIDCGSGAGCTDNFPLNSVITLTAAPNNGSFFGGFSANCTPVIPDPSGCTAKSNDVQSCTCSVTMGDNATVGAIFNTAQ